jgi:hypothetical protein
LIGGSDVMIAGQRHHDSVQGRDDRLRLSDSKRSADSISLTVFLSLQLSLLL